MNKIISKNINDKLDSFITKRQGVMDTQLTDELEVQNQKKSKLKKNDGLIERVDISKKVFITEDNRQLLSD